MSLKDKLVGPTEDEVLENFNKKHLEEIEKLNKKHNQDILLKSCKLGLIKGVKGAVENGADINYDGGEPLYLSISNGHGEIVKYLIDVGVKMDIFNKKPVTKTNKRTGIGYGVTNDDYNYNHADVFDDDDDGLSHFFRLKEQLHLIEENMVLL